MRRLQFAASKAIIAKALYARGYETDSAAKKVFMQLCRLLPRRALETLCIRRGDDRTALLHSFLAAGKRYEKNLLPREWLTESVELPFEDGVFPVTAHYDALLTQLYGNWRAFRLRRSAGARSTRQSSISSTPTRTTLPHSRQCVLMSTRGAPLTAGGMYG